MLHGAHLQTPCGQLVSSRYIHIRGQCWYMLLQVEHFVVILERIVLKRGNSPTEPPSLSQWWLGSHAYCSSTEVAVHTLLTLISQVIWATFVLSDYSVIVTLTEINNELIKNANVLNFVCIPVYPSICYYHILLGLQPPNVTPYKPLCNGLYTPLLKIYD